MKIVGVSGRDRSGKDTVAELLMEAGYFGFSFGDALRVHARKRHAKDPNPISVANMTDTSNWLRTEKGADALLKEALEAYDEALVAGKKYKGVVLYSVRAPVEVSFILAKGGELIWVDATDKTRLERRLANIRPGESKVTMEEMLAQEALQANPQPDIPEQVQMNLNYVKKHATRVLENNGNDLSVFKKTAKAMLGL